MSDALKKKMKEKIPDDPSKTMGLYTVVLIAVGAKYDLTANVNVTDGMTNGAECIVEKIDYRVTNSNRPSIIWVSFPQTNIGKSHRKEYAPAGSSCSISIEVCARMFSRNSSCYVFGSAILVVLKTAVEVLSS